MMTTMNSHKRFYINTIWQYGLQLVKYILPLLTLPYLTRVLEPDGYAVYAYVLSFMAFAQTVVDFGFNLSGTKQIAASRNVDQVNRVVGSIMQARLLLCVVAGAGCAAIGWFVPIIHANAEYAILAYIAVCGRSLAPDFLFQGKENMRPITTRYFASKGTSTALTFVFVQSAADLLWVPILDIVASAIALTWSFASARKLFGSGIARVSLREVFWEMKESGYYFVSNMASTIFSGFTTLLIGIVITDSIQISYWSLAMTAVGAVQSLFSPIISSLYPHMVVSGDFAFAKRLARVSIPFVIVGTIGFALLSDIIVAVLGGYQYADGTYVFKLVSPIIFFSFYGMFFGWPVLGAAGQVKEIMQTTIWSSAFSVAALLSITALGIASVATFAVVRSLAEALMCALRLNECRKHFPIPRTERRADG